MINLRKVCAKETLRNENRPFEIGVIIHTDIFACLDYTSKKSLAF